MNSDAWRHSDAWDDDWDGPIRSDSRLRMWVGWGFAAVWNLISAPLLFVLPGEVAGGNTPALIGFLFPVVGVGLIAYAVKRTREWRLYGPTELTLDPHPGAIGGHVGGVISLTRAAARQPFEVTLRCKHSYVSGSGKNRSRTEEVVWQSRGPASVRTGGARPSLMFRFEVPAGLPATEPKGGDYHLWELGLESANESTEVPLSRAFRIPVFPTRQRSAAIDVDTGASGQQAVADQLRDAIRDGGADQAALEALRDDHGLAIERRGEWLRLYFPTGRGKLAAGICGTVGVSFCAVGLGLFGAEAGGLMRAIFGCLGLAALGFALYLPLNSLDVRIHRERISATRRFLGFTLGDHELTPSDIRGIELKKGSTTTLGTKTIVRYGLVALLGDGRKVKVAEGIDGQSAARALRDLFMAQAGLRRAG